MQKEFEISKGFTRIVTVRKYADPDKFELKIQTKWAGAKNPDELQNEFQWITTADQLVDLQKFIEKAVNG